MTTILAELGMNEPTLCAALLHDTVEDTDYTLAELTRDFGEEVALLVDGCTKVDKIKYGESAKSDTIRKMIIAMSRDIRVLVIKLADRLHNMRTLHYLRPDKQSRIAQETLEIFAPLAHRLGMNAIKWELEDLSFGTLHPKIYDEIVRMVAEAAPSRDEFLSKVIEQVQADLRAAKIKASVTGRPKHYYSIYQKMIVRGRDFTDIFDLVGLRVLVESNRDCYAALGVLHVRWNPLPGRFKDYIAMPKFNMYQSLHTTVLGPEGSPVELQIRTDEMHRRAEYGVAAHWKYKEGKGTPLPAKGGDDAGDLVWVRQLLDWQTGDRRPVGVPRLPAVRDQLDRGVRVHPQGRGRLAAAGLDADRLRVRDPHRGRPQDHRRPGQRPAGAAGIGPDQRRPGRDLHLQGPERRAEPGLADLRPQPAGPEQDPALLHPRAPGGVDRERQGGARPADAQGRAAAAAPAHPGAPDRGRRLLQAARRVTALYAAVGEGTVGAQAVVNRLIIVEGGEEMVADETSEDRVVTGRRRRSGSTGGRAESGIRVIGASDLLVKLAKCCTPVPGDQIMGFVTKGSGVSVHRMTCVNAASLRKEPERLVSVEWAPTAKSSFLVAIQVEALDRNRLLSDITRALSDQHVNILSAGLNTTKDRICRAKFTFETADPTHLDHVLRAIRSVPAVFDVYRISQ